MTPVRSRLKSPCFAMGLMMVLLAANAQAGPLVSSITPNAARPGDVLEVKGMGFTGTREVMFVSGQAIKMAKLKVLADHRMDVTFPEYYRGAGSASMIVLGANSVTVAMPRSMQTIDANAQPNVSGPFLRIVNDGTVSQGTGIIVVGEGGVLAKLSSSPVCFVKNKGIFGESQGVSFLFHEPGAVLNSKLYSSATPPRFVSVQEITISHSIEPVVIKALEAPQPFAKHPPVLTSITPQQAAPGDIIVLKGKNFSRVSSVYFIGPTQTLSEAGFKAISDDTLRVEIAQHLSRRQLIVVMNPAGIAVNITEQPSRPVLNQAEARRELVKNALFQVEYVGAGEFKPSGGSRICVIENGGIVTSGGGNCCFLVRSGGRLAGATGGGCTLFHEPGATVPLAAAAQAPRSRLLTVDVDKINFSPTPLHLDIEPR